MEEQLDISFEQAITRLEEIVRVLDSGELSLNESLLLFEEGIKLARECSRQLAEAQGQLETIVRSPNGNLGTEPLEL